MQEKQQLDKFKEAAREAECDTDEAAFDKALGEIAKTKPEPKEASEDNQEQSGPAS